MSASHMIHPASYFIIDLILWMVGLIINKGLPVDLSRELGVKYQ